MVLLFISIYNCALQSWKRLWGPKTIGLGEKVKLLLLDEKKTKQNSPQAAPPGAAAAAAGLTLLSPGHRLPVLSTLIPCDTVSCDFSCLKRPVWDHHSHQRSGSSRPCVRIPRPDDCNHHDNDDCDDNDDNVRIPRPGQDDINNEDYQGDDPAS